MILVEKKILRYLPTSVIWFADRPTLKHCLNGYYKQCTYKKKVLGYQRFPFFTKLIDLSKEFSEIEQDFHPKTAYEIRRAMKDGIVTSLENEVGVFLNFYNEFADTKKLPRLSHSLKGYDGQLTITKATIDQQDVAMHAYVCDFPLKRVRLLYSASLFRNETSPAQRASIGRANRLLHFSDISLFKNQGYNTYDLGGYALSTENQDLMRINQFKDGFGGKLVEESDFLPLTSMVYAVLTKFWKA